MLSTMDAILTEIHTPVHWWKFFFCFKKRHLTSMICIWYTCTNCPVFVPISRAMILGSHSICSSILGKLFFPKCLVQIYCSFSELLDCGLWAALFPILRHVCPLLCHCINDQYMASKVLLLICFQCLFFDSLSLQSSFAISLESSIALRPPINSKNLLITRSIKN